MKQSNFGTVTLSHVEAYNLADMINEIVKYCNDNREQETGLYVAGRTWFTESQCEILRDLLKIVGTPSHKEQIETLKRISKNK